MKVRTSNQKGRCLSTGETIRLLEPRLTRQGYIAKVLAEVLNAKPRQMRALLRGQLAPGRAQELQHEMLAVGIPL